MRIALALLITLAALIACGKKGALVLPDTPPTSAPAQASTFVPGK